MNENWYFVKLMVKVYIKGFSFFLEMNMKTLRRRCTAWGNWEEKGNQGRERGRELPRKNEQQLFCTGFMFLSLFSMQADSMGLCSLSQWRAANPERIPVAGSELSCCFVDHRGVNTMMRKSLWPYCCCFIIIIVCLIHIISHVNSEVHASWC